MIFNGASVEEVEAAIDKKEKEKREYQERAKQQAMEEHKSRDLKSRLSTAEALVKAGVISKQDYEKIKQDVEAEFNNLKQNETITENASETQKDEKNTEEQDKNN